MSSGGMLLLLSALLLHSAMDGSAASTGNSTDNINSTSPPDESCSCGRRTDVEALLCANDSLKAFLKPCRHPSMNSSCACVKNDAELPGVSSVTVFEKDCSCIVLCCRDATEVDKLKELLENVWMILKQPQVIAAFLTGVLLSAFVCLLVRKCHRKKPRGSRNKADGVATSQAVPLTDGQSADNGFGEGEAGAAGHSAVEPREVEYSDIDFSRWNRNSPTGGEHAQEAAETEYAELQKDRNSQEPEENSGDSEEGVAVAIDEEETEQ